MLVLLFVPLTLADEPGIAFANHAAPGSLGTAGGEPSIGVNPHTGMVFVQAWLRTLRVDLSTQPPSWTNVAPVLTSLESFDPILFTDQATGRTFVSQLNSGCSYMAYTDDDGASWVQNPLGCGLFSGVDHQTVGGGAYAPGVPVTAGAVYPHSVYYCAQSGIVSGTGATCALSTDGGLTFKAPATGMYGTADCWGLHGHVKVAPDGTAYVPNSNCRDKQAVVVSTNNGASWFVRRVPDSVDHVESDPSVAIGSGGRAYFCYQDASGHPKVATTSDKGKNWTPSVDIGAALGIQNAQFPAAVAGDDDRAACAFLGTPTAGNDQVASFTGAWHLYVAFTYDAGATWTLVDATPDDPVQRGCIWLQGGGNACRNLLDFMDATLDAEGRVLIAYADGCTETCATGETTQRSALATLAVQTSGKGLLAAHDP